MKMKLNEEHLGGDSTKSQAVAMVEKLQSRGYDVEYGTPVRGETLDEIPDVEFLEVLREVLMESPNLPQHTPGPWRVKDEGITSIDGIHVCDVEGYGSTEEQNEVNARLIASAPELLSSCLSAIKYLDKVKELTIGLSSLVPMLPESTIGNFASELHTICSNTRKIRAVVRGLN